MRRRVLLTVLLLLPWHPLAAKKLYKYQDAQGNWQFSDRPPAADQPVEVEQLRVERRSRRLRVQRKGLPEAPVLHIVNGYHGPVEVEISAPELRNMTSTPGLPHRFVVPAVSELAAVQLAIRNQAKRWRYRYRYRYTLGSPSARHQADIRYLAPFPRDRRFRIMQGFGGDYSHHDDHNWHAIDIAMPEGTPIHAARGGIVMDTVGDFFEGGPDRQRFGDKTNLVRILHADGTIAMYAHLELESLAVSPGMTVEAGQWLARSGNTGFSSGPHLHFVVQRNAGLKTVSVPFVFRGERVPERGMWLAR